ncbi:MAG: 30S ribosomal protein S12 methylthiotransferase RimO [Magnetococcales bacterium]|nr:30S ribosomal protein S12 methylthiotransferase RimO [Magnetococcales bacterium]MBF0322034.1 30S ribosomal protein S12 methylthiotransferase RimO [Magnetococcales bacterium]
MSGNSDRKIGVISLGCAKNQVDSEFMLGQFRNQGYQLTNDPEQADILVVNTCAFVAEAEAESRDAIREMLAVKMAHPGKRVVVTGCLSQRYGERLAQDFSGLDVILGSGQYQRLIPLVNSKNPNPEVPLVGLGPPTFLPKGSSDRVLTTPGHTAYVKIAEGCNNPCTFCIIPKLRGPFRSRMPRDIELEVRRLAKQGVKEINLVSQDTTLYGRDLSPRTDLPSLLNRLGDIDGIQWIRMLYLYPTLISDRLLITILRHEKILPYLDMPLQHFHTHVLTRMKRAERAPSVGRLLRRIRGVLPDAIIRTTMLVGFPGETDEEFQALYNFVAEARFDHLGVFAYSKEEGTPASDMADQVPHLVAEERRAKLMTLQQGISRDKLARLVGQTLPVLVDHVSPGGGVLMQGRYAGQAPDVDGVVYINDGSHIKPGSIVPVKITESHEYDLVGRVVSAPVEEPQG